MIISERGLLKLIGFKGIKSKKTLYEEWWCVLVELTMRRRLQTAVHRSSQWVQWVHLHLQGAGKKLGKSVSAPSQAELG